MLVLMDLSRARILQRLKNNFKSVKDLVEGLKPPQCSNES